MKMKPSELKQIIKEEALRLKKRMMLEAERDNILKKLQEIEECEYMEEGVVDEIFGLGEKPEAKRERMKKTINTHPSYSKTSGVVANKYRLDPAFVYEKLVDFFVANNGIPTGGLAWDDNKKVFVDKTVYRGTAPGMQGAAE